jgi:hypothetical protein
MSKYMFGMVIVTALLSFTQTRTLTGTWQYAGGINNGKIYGAPKGYKQQRIYNSNSFEAFLLENGEKPVKYEAGIYTLVGDSCMEKQTYSMQPSSLTGKTVRYGYMIRNDTLFLIGRLPNKISVLDYWKKVQ